MPATAHRKPLDAQIVGKINADAMKALADNRVRAKWGNSNSGSLVSTNMLCAEIARLNIALDVARGVLCNCRPYIERASEHSMTDEAQAPFVALLAEIDSAVSE